MTRRETGTQELESILGRSYLAQVAAKKKDVVEGESVTVGEPEGGSVMGDMMEETDVEEREEDEESVGKEEGEPGSEEEVEGEEGEEMQIGEGGDDEDCESETPPPSDIDDCDWVVLRCSIHDIIH